MSAGILLAHHETAVSPLLVPNLHSRAVLTALALAAGSLFCGQATAAGDAAAGKTVFANQCSSCTRRGREERVWAVTGRRDRQKGGRTCRLQLLAGDGAGRAVLGREDPRRVPHLVDTESTRDFDVGDAHRRDRPGQRDRVPRNAGTGEAGRERGGCARPRAPSQGPTQEELLRAAQDKQNWLYASKDYTGQRFVDLRQITPKKAGNCAPPASIARTTPAPPRRTRWSTKASCISRSTRPSSRSMQPPAASAGPTTGSERCRAVADQPRRRAEGRARRARHRRRLSDRGGHGQGRSSGARRSPMRSRASISACRR